MLVWQQGSTVLFYFCILLTVENLPPEQVISLFFRTDIDEYTSVKPFTTDKDQKY